MRRVDRRKIEKGGNKEQALKELTGEGEKTRGGQLEKQRSGERKTKLTRRGSLASAGVLKYRRAKIQAKGLGPKDQREGETGPRKKKRTQELVENNERNGRRKKLIPGKVAAAAVAWCARKPVWKKRRAT